MKFNVKWISTLLAGMVLLTSGYHGLGAETKQLADELKDLVSRINTKLALKHKSATELSGEMKEFDALLTKHHGEQPEILAEVLFVKAQLLLQVLDQPKQAGEVLKQLQRDFPNSQPAKHIDSLLDMFTQQAAAKKIQDELVSGRKFPDFQETDLVGHPLTLAHFKGKVLLVDFWATWCASFRQELPNVLEVYKHHHPQGFEIIGVSLDQERSRLEAFLKDQGMTWSQYFDGKGWKNKLAAKYGITRIPSSFLLDGEGRILGKNLAGKDLENAVTTALARK